METSHTYTMCIGVDEWYQQKLKFPMFYFCLKIVNQKCNTKIIQTFKGRVISV